eukprot:656223-Rhodomonas_salina.2
MIIRVAVPTARRRGRACAPTRSPPVLWPRFPCAFRTCKPGPQFKLAIIIIFRASDSLSPAETLRPGDLWSKAACTNLKRGYQRSCVPGPGLRREGLECSASAPRGHSVSPGPDP